MMIRLLGSAAGGGFPQWNCACMNCRGMRDGTVAATARTQTSAAISADGERWFLLNASPDFRAQIEACEALHPRSARHSPIAGVVLANGTAEACLGVLSMRERQPLTVWATEEVWWPFAKGNLLVRGLAVESGNLTWRALPHGKRVMLVDGDAEETGLTIEAVPLPGKLPRHLAGLAQPREHDNVAVVIKEIKSGRTLVWAPSVAGPTSALSWLLASAQCICFDGTFWSDDELTAIDSTLPTAETMAHWPLGGPQGSLGMLAGYPSPQRILVHMNNTNPVLREDSDERAQVTAAGVEVGYDGLEITL